MSMHDRADEEMAALEEDLANGDITETEFKRHVRDIGEEMRQYEQGEY
jgi:uncharacterized membrane protein